MARNHEVTRSLRVQISYVLAWFGTASFRSHVSWWCSTLEIQQRNHDGHQHSYFATTFATPMHMQGRQLTTRNYQSRVQIAEQMGQTQFTITSIHSVVLSTLHSSSQTTSQAASGNKPLQPTHTTNNNNNQQLFGDNCDADSSGRCGS
jgi:hypothetical protein